MSAKPTPPVRNDPVLAALDAAEAKDPVELDDLSADERLELAANIAAGPRGGISSEELLARLKPQE